MNQTSQLELSLRESFERFEGIVRTLLESCSLEDTFSIAQNVNIASIGLMEFFYEDSSNGRAYFKEARTYSNLIRSCLRKFQEIIPSLNGQAWHVDLYREQMQGRIKLINRIYRARD